MFGDDEEIRSDKDLAADYRSGMERQDRLIAMMQADLDAKQAEIVNLRKTVDGLMSDMPTVHKRKCRDCGSVSWHADNITPYVLCPKCKSQDTGRVTP